MPCSVSALQGISNMSNKSVSALRAEVLRKHRNAQNKMARLARSKGVVLRGTEHDVLRDRQRVSGYTRKQLAAYAAQLDAFNDRKNQYLRGAEKTIITSREFRKLKQAERDFNRRANEFFNRIKDIKLPAAVGGTGISIGDRLEMLNRSPDYFENRAGVTPFSKRYFNPKNIVGDKSVKKLTEMLRGSFGAEYINKHMSVSRNMAVKWAENMGMPDEFIERVQGLTDEQMLVWYHYTDAAEKMGIRYDSLHALGEKAASIAEDAEDSLMQSVSWAGGLDIGSTR